MLELINLQNRPTIATKPTRPSHANMKPKNAVVCSVSTDVILEGTLSFVFKEC